MYNINPKTTTKIIQQRAIAHKPTKERKQKHKKSIQKKTEEEKENKTQMGTMKNKEQSSRFKSKYINKHTKYKWHRQPVVG